MPPIPPTVLSELHHIKVADPNLDVADFPDFLLIGPQRTGTTWLAKNLARHPEVFIPAGKELFFFYRHRGYWPDYLPPFEDDLGWYLRLFRPTEQERAARTADSMARFGERIEVTRRGEATASYAVGVPDDVVREIVAIKPDIRVIMMVRNPIDRAWSHAKKDLSRSRGRPIGAVSLEEYQEFFGNWFYRRCSLFTEIAERWMGLVGAERFHVDRFDEIQRDPLGLLQRVFAFVGVRDDADFVDAAVAARRVETTSDVAMPEPVRELLEGIYADELSRLATLGYRF